MKKSIIITLLLAILLAAFTTQAMAQATEKIGTIALLNLSEEQYAAIQASRNIAYNYLMDNGILQEAMPRSKGSAEITYYDTLDALVMGLQSGTVGSINLPQTTAEYICANNDALQMPFSIDMDKADRLIFKDLIKRSGSGFAFMMLEEQAELRDQFNEAISAMEEDGTLASLQKQYIQDVISGGEIKAIEFEKFEGDPIRMAVTGSLPPMDYVAPDGTFAGFNTALLSEIGKRLERNIELVQVDSLGRAAALASGTVDVVFWTQTTPFSGMSAKEREANAAERAEERAANYTEEEQKLWQDITTTRGLDRNNEGNQDMPEGTICTRQYFMDAIVMVTMKAK